MKNKSNESFSDYEKKFSGVAPDSMEIKRYSFKITAEPTEVKVNGEDMFRFEGYASTHELDRGGDIVAPGAFKNTIEKNKLKNNRPVRMKYQHDAKELIGKFPIELMKEDARGLKVVGFICKGVQRGKEVISLIKTGCLSDLSIGFNVIDFEMKDNARIIKDMDLWEISIVDEPMNPGSVMTAFKSVVPFHDLPIAPDSHKWDKSAAERRVRDLTGSKTEAAQGYRRAFFWFDSAKPKEFTSYKLPFADVVNGKLMAVPRALYAVAAVLDGGRGGVDIPEADKAKIKSQVTRYYKKMDKEAPFKQKSIEKITNIEIKEALSSSRELERLFKSTGVFSERASKMLTNLVKSRASELEEQFEEGKYAIDEEEGVARPGESFSLNDGTWEDEDIAKRKRKRRKRSDEEFARHEKEGDYEEDEDEYAGKANPMDAGMSDEEEDCYGKSNRKRNMKIDRYESEEDEIYDDMYEDLDELEDIQREEEGRRVTRRRKSKLDDMLEDLEDYETGDEIMEREGSEINDLENYSPRRRKTRSRKYEEGFEDRTGLDEYITEEEDRLARGRKKVPGFDMSLDEEDPEFEDLVGDEEGRLLSYRKRRKAYGDDIGDNYEDEGFEREVGEGEAHNETHRAKRRRKAYGDDIGANYEDIEYQDEIDEEEGRLARRRRRSKDLEWDDERVPNGDSMDDYEDRERAAEYYSRDSRDNLRKLLREARKTIRDMRDMGF